MSDRTVQAQSERKDGLADLYRRHARWLTLQLRRRFGPEAEDLVQDAWVRVAAMDNLEAVRHPKAFLLRVATNQALMDMRHRAVVDRHQTGHPPQDRMDADQLEVLAFKQMVLDLPRPLRDVFVLSRVAGLSNVQIAERLGISHKTVEWRMTRALAQCARQLRR